MTVPAAHSIRRAIIVVFVNRYATFAINFAAAMVLARLVGPAETGLFSVAASIVLLAQAIRDFGIGEFLVQERELTSAKIRTAFGLTLILSWSLGFAVLLARHLIADLYHTPELSGLVTIVAGSFAVAPFSSTVLALLNRQMAFGTMFRISLASTVANQAVSITLATMGFGAAALTYGMLAANVTTALVASLSVRSRDHIIPSLREWRRLASYGAFISSANIVHQIGARAPDLIIGRMLGFHPLGLYNRSLGIVGLFSDLVVFGLQSVAFPAFAGAHHAGKDLREPYLRAVAIVTVIMLPLLGLLALFARPVVQVLLGAQWLDSGRLIPLLCIGAALDAMTPMVPHLLNATGRVKIVLRVAILLRSAQLLVVGGFAGFGLTWLAAGQIVLSFTGLLVNAHALRQAASVRLADLLRAARPAAVAAAATVALPALVLARPGAEPDTAWAPLGLGAALGAAAWFAAVAALRHPVRHEIGGLLSEMRAIVGRRT